jgi:hypothetical protein
VRNFHTSARGASMVTVPVNCNDLACHQVGFRLAGESMFTAR